MRLSAIVEDPIMKEVQVLRLSLDADHVSGQDDGSGWSAQGIRACIR